MEDFIETVRYTYRSRGISLEERWPPVFGKKIITLELVEAEEMEEQQPRNDKVKVKRTSILYSDLLKFEQEEDPVKRIVLVEGNAGIGKTTLCLMLAKGWAQKKILTQFSCVLLLPLRETVVSSATGLQSLLKLFYQDKNEDQKCETTMKELQNTKGKGLLIIADGWDELDEKSRSKDSYLHKLLIGAILPSASVLLTSRYSALAPFKYYIKDHWENVCFVEVMGFTDDNIKQYIESEFAMYPEKALALIEQLDNNPLIQSVCSIPLNCAIICNVWRKRQQKLPKTLTQLYSLLVLTIINRDIRKSFPEFPQLDLLKNFDIIHESLKPRFWQTCKFAYECLLLDQIVFSKEEVSSYFPEVSNQNTVLCLGLLQSTESLLFKELTFHFAHLTIQEFLAALHIATQSKRIQKTICYFTYARSDRFSMVWRFLFGLGTTATFYSEKINSLDDQLLNSFLMCFKDKALMLCHFASEINNDTFSLKVACKISGKFSVSDNLHDCAAVFHVLRHASPCSDIDLDLSGCGLGDKQILELTDILSNAGSKLLVKSLSINDNKLTDKGINFLLKRASASFSQLESLDCENNNIERIIFSSSTSITDLCASNNPFNVRGIHSLAKAAEISRLAKLESLSLSSTFIGPGDDVGTELNMLLSSISSQCSQLTSLDLSKNYLGEHGAYVVGKALPLLSSGKRRFNLDLSESNLSSGESIALSKGLLDMLSQESCPMPFTESSHCDLTLCNNPIGHQGLLALFRMLGGKNCPITDLDLDKSNFDSEIENDTPETTRLVTICETASFSSFVTTLNLNNIETSTGTHIIMLEKAVKEGVLSSLESLYLSKTFTDDPDRNGALLSALLEPLALYCRYLTHIDLSKNMFGVAAACSLGKAFLLFTRSRNEFNIDLKMTDLNSEAMSVFCSCIITFSKVETIPNSSKIGDYEVSFEGNPLGYDGFAASFEMLKSENCPITTLNLDQVHYTEIVSEDEEFQSDFADEPLNVDTTHYARSSRLTTLHLNQNNAIYDSKHIMCLERAARHGSFVNLENLHLSDTLSEDASHNGIILTKLLPTIASHCTHLVQLDLSDNKIDVTGAVVLGEVFPHLSRNGNKFELDLSDCNLNNVRSN